MNVFCEAEGQAHRLSFKWPILLYAYFQQLTTLEGEYYLANTLNLTFDPDEQDLEQILRALCNEAERKVRDGTVLLVLSDPPSPPVPASTIQTCLMEKSLHYDAKSSLKPSLPTIHNISRCYSALVPPPSTRVSGL